MKDDDLDHLADELNAFAAPAPAHADTSVLERWLTTVRERGGSDLLLVAGSPPIVRAAGRLEPAADGVMDGEEIAAALRPFLSSRLLARYREGEAVDFAIRVTGLGRFRVNLHRERGRAAAALRALPLVIPTVADLNFTHDVGRLARLKRGLVLVGGPTGSGKTTTLAALVGDINRREQRHIITVEDPIEYEHAHDRSLVEQVEIGVDAPDFPTALRAALRQAPDVMVVGEMRDPESIRIAVSAAETGHLVFATVHTTDVAAAVARITDAFPTERQNGIRQELAMALAAVLTQTLVPTVTGALRPAAELLMVGYGSRQHIRRNTLQHFHQEIAITRKAGSFTLEESLAALVAGGHLSREDARLRAAHPEDFDLTMKK